MHSPGRPTLGQSALLAELAIGIDFGGTKMLGAAVDRQGKVVADLRVPTPYDGNELLDAMTQVVEELEARVGHTAGVGIGAAGMVSRDGVLHYGPNVGGVAELDIVAGLASRLPGRLVRVDNDNTCATWGECRFGAGKGVDELLFVGLGTGIGAGIVSEGRLLRGHNGFAAEVGHMTIEVGGVACVCGREGCWEAYASGRALGRLGREAAARGRNHRAMELAGAVDNIRGEHVAQAAREGDRNALAVFDEFARWLALGIGNLIAVLDPQRVVIGGGLSGESDLFFRSTQQHLANVLYGAANRPEVPLVVAMLGVRAGAVGAAMLVHGEAPDVA